MIQPKLKMRIFTIALLLSISTLQAQDLLEIDKVWTGHQVGFALLTKHNNQYIAFYNAERQMTVGQRKLNDEKFQLTILPKSPETSLGWDSHNYVTIGMDDKGYIHLSGNMHAVPLIYFKGNKPYDISTLQKVDVMVGENEKRCTYPRFINTKEGHLIFTYRDGGSGNGNQIYNKYNAETKKWSRLLDTPLTDGQGLMNAYITIPKLAEDGWYHCAWVWRDTPDCSTNHDLSYIKSPDLLHWFTASGEQLELPITPKEKRVIVDNTQANGGMINGGFQYCLDINQKPTFVYHKYDKIGNIQLYIASFNDNFWTSKQLTNWDYRWEFSGNGSINSELKILSISLTKEQNMAITFWHIKYGEGLILLNTDLEILNIQYAEKAIDPGVFNGLLVQKTSDLGQSDDEYTYQLKWESLGKNRDKSSALPTPPPSILYLQKFKASE
jgi:hypothetical protein